MKIHHTLDKLSEIHNPVVTTGSFDGVHVGHAAIIRRLRKLAKDISGESVLITFHPHPRRVLYPDSAGKNLLLICSEKEKIKLLKETELDHLVIINFTKEFSLIPPDKFVKDILIGKLGAKIIVVGFNHHFGHNRAGDFSYLYELSHKNGFEVEEIPEQDIQNESVSSTKIRNALQEGNIQRANAYLDHFYVILGKAESNPKHSKAFAMKIMNLRIDEDVKLIPPDGVYAVHIESDNDFSRGMFSIAGMDIDNNVLAEGLELEFHPFEEEIDFNGRNVCISFHKKIRESEGHIKSGELKKQLLKDKKEISELIF